MNIVLRRTDTVTMVVRQENMEMYANTVRINKSFVSWGFYDRQSRAIDGQADDLSV